MYIFGPIFLPPKHIMDNILPLGNLISPIQARYIMLIICYLNSSLLGKAVYSPLDTQCHRISLVQSCVQMGVYRPDGCEHAPHPNYPAIGHPSRSYILPAPHSTPVEEYSSY